MEPNGGKWIWSTRVLSLKVGGMKRGPWRMGLHGPRGVGNECPWTIDKAGQNEGVD